MNIVDKEELKNAIDFIYNLTKGRDPIFNVDIVEDTIIKNREYQKRLIYVKDALTFLYRNLHNNYFRIYEEKPALQLREDEIDQIRISDEPISVSALTYKINDIADVNKMKKLKATQITKWLMEQGYLKEDEERKTNHKICTDRAAQIGIIEVEKENEYGNKYKVNLYSTSAQKYIIKNINTIGKL